ncbi:hypothetical protein C437_12376, partial [Haloarcula vallismortis ATCC 29715]
LGTNHNYIIRHNPDSMSIIPSGAKMGSTNLACRHCDTALDLLEMRAVNASNLTPDGLFQCPYCSSWYYPEIGLLHSLYGDGQVEKEYFGTPLSLGGTQKRDLNHVKAGEHRPIKMHSLEPGYEYDSIYLLGGHRDGVDEDNWLSFDLVGAQNRAMLGDSVLISLLRTDATEITINATLRENRASKSPIGFGDTLEVVYAATTQLGGVTNPPWIDLLQEAQEAIRQGNTLAALPVLRSAVDNCLIRQMFVYQLWDGHEQESARQSIEDLEDKYDPNRITIAKHGLEQATGTRLTDGPYDTLWADFSQVVEERDAIIHSETASQLAHPDQSTAIDFFNTTVSLLVAAYDLFGFHNSSA